MEWSSEERDLDRERDIDRDRGDRPDPREPGNVYSTPLERGDPSETSAFQDEEQHIKLREERLAARTERQRVGEVVVHKETVETPGRAEVEVVREEVEVEHVPIGRVVEERSAPRDEDGVMVVPVYEEQLVVAKRLVLREELRIKRVKTPETRIVEDTLRKERLVVEDPEGTGAVHEIYPTDAEVDRCSQGEAKDKGNVMGRMVRKILE